MTFRDGDTLGTATVSNGTATYTTSAFPGGSNIITASYSGDLNYSPATSATLTVTVTTVTLASSNQSVGYGTPVTFTATIPPNATGTVLFQDSGTTLGTGVASGGIATFTTSSLTVGQHSITASCSGDSNYSGATSANLLQLVTTSSQEIMTRALPNGIQNWSYTATLQITGGTAPYSWSVSSGSLPAGLTLTGATGTISGTPTTSGTSAFTVVATDAALNSVSAPLSIVINPAEAPLQIASLSPSSGSPGMIVTVIGSNFGANQAEGSIAFNGSVVSALQWSDNTIVFAVPSGIDAGQTPVTVTVAGTSSSAVFTVQGTASCSGD
ncbi:MAG: hypothetical protein CXZ00_05165 [Acidobacteria bacterium]|nr:MAG: hypothetical protein CXZ00_05165 [Acidobacteriota bacterium]